MRLLQSVGNGGRLVGLALILSSLGSADTILFQRALPQGPNVNAAGASRSNVDWINQTDTTVIPSNYFINGDDFVVPAGTSWQISSIAVFLVLNKAGDVPSDEFSDFTLYLASDTGDQQPQTFSVVSTTVTPTLANFVGVTAACTSSPNFYLASDGTTCLPVYMMSFSTNITLGPGTYDFAADGTLKSISGCAGTCGWYNLATNASLAGGSTEDGADDLYKNWFAGTPTPATSNLDFGYITVNSAGGNQNGPCGSPTADICGGFTSSTDMNVIITGQAVPEPGSMTMIGLAGLAVAIAGIRRRITAR
jgi:hypothetical protein